MYCRKPHTFEPGDKAVVQDLGSQPELNAMIVTVQGQDAIDHGKTSSCWRVSLPSDVAGSHFSISAANLRYLMPG